MDKPLDCRWCGSVPSIVPLYDFVVAPLFGACSEGRSCELGGCRAHPSETIPGAIANWNAFQESQPEKEKGQPKWTPETK